MLFWWQLSVPSRTCLKAVIKFSLYKPVPNIQWRTPDDGQRNCTRHVEFFDKNKFGKLVRLLVLLKRKMVTLSIHLWCHRWQIYSNKGQVHYVHLHIPWLYETSKIQWLASILAINKPWNRMWWCEWDLSGSQEVPSFCDRSTEPLYPATTGKLVHWPSNNWILENDSVSYIGSCNVERLHEYKT